HVAQTIVTLANEAKQHGRPFNIALAGGSTPKYLYSYLASPLLAEKIAWGGVNIYFGDERAVPPSHADSNYGLAKKYLLDQLPIPSENIHRMYGEVSDLHQAAAAYNQLLEEQLPHTATGVPQFDLILLGLGGDGHVASLFPGSPVLTEREKWVAAAYIPALTAWRISLTLPILNHSKRLFLLVAGAAKAAIIAEVLEHPQPHARYPVELLQPQGELHWFLDQAVAHRLEPPTP
ncbi:MAG: pgl, partial [Halothiobacillaceae bacterium]